VKVIFEQAIGIRLCRRLDVLDIQLQEIAIVALLHENVLAVGAAIVDVIEHTRLEWRWTGHRLAFPQDPKGFLKTLRVSKNP
jgi:hypothetical protein